VVKSPVPIVLCLPSSITRSQPQPQPDLPHHTIHHTDPLCALVQLWRGGFAFALQQQQQRQTTAALQLQAKLKGTEQDRQKLTDNLMD